MPIPSEIFSKVPANPGLYCLLEKKEVVYVGISKDLRSRLKQHFVLRDSSITTGTSAASLNPEYIETIKWWTHEDFKTKAKLQAAELVAFETFNPILRSRGKSTDKAKEQLTPTFKRSMKAIFQKPPSGELSIPNMSHLLRRIEELEKQKTQS